MAKAKKTETEADSGLIEVYVNAGRKFNEMVRDGNGKPAMVLRTGGDAVMVTKNQLDKFRDALTTTDAIDKFRVAKQDALEATLAAVEAKEEAQGKVENKETVDG